MKRTSAAACLALLAGSLLAAAPVPPAAPRITPREASRHAGEEVMVCGLVAGTKYASGVPGQPTFLDFGAAYPDELFRVVIWGTARGRFHDSPEQVYKRKQVCATGRIELYRGKPEIVVKDPAQLVFDKVLGDPNL
jgi:DNA/RNA endonuclease YhcR with UshA esterase domain